MVPNSQTSKYLHKNNFSHIVTLLDIEKKYFCVSILMFVYNSPDGPHVILPYKTDIKWKERHLTLYLSQTPPVPDETLD